jgi:Methyltransferase domain
MVHDQAMKKPEVVEYLNATSKVEGWFFPIDAYAIAMIDEIQRRENIGGNLFEVGAHHGKTAMFLARTATIEETVGVCDIFEDHGGREVFLENIRRFTEIPPERLSIFSKRSASLTSDETTTKCRFFHIDGGHRAEDVFADLVTADRAVLPDGVLAVDDVFNANWPGVSEGFYSFHTTRPDAFVPIFIGGNKVYLTRPDAAAIYEKHWSGEGAQSEFFESGPFELEFRDWLGRRLLTAVHPNLGPASWKKRILGILGQ